MRRISVLFLLIAALILAACQSAAPLVATQPEVEPAATPTPALAAAPAQPAGAQASQLAELTDSQGNVIVVVKPSELSTSQGRLSFEVTLDTHSIDLSMDLAVMATLTSDTGVTVQAARWEAPLGGHHVSGVLSFPSSVEGNNILDGASRLTLVIKDLDAPERVFTWDLQ